MKSLKDILKKLISKKTTLIAIAVMFALSGVLQFFDRTSGFVALGTAAAYTVAIIVRIWYKNKKMSFADESPMLSGMTLEFVMSLALPVVIVSSNGEIAWYNKAFLTASGSKGALYSKSLSEKIHSSLTPARLFRAEAAPVHVPMNGIDYEVSCYRVSSADKNYCITLWENKTNEMYLKNELELRNALVAFVVIDNFSEAMQYAQDKSRTASAVIGSEIDKWCASMGGIIKEYDKEKYVVIFEQRHLEELCQAEFEILDTIRSICIDDVAMRFTVSIGIGKASGTLAQKEAASRSALELALQRGGDQAAVKEEGTVSFYGRKSKGVVKKTKVRSRVFVTSLADEIKKSSNVLVMGHKNADFDSIASCVAVSRIAKSLEKPVNVVININDANLKPVFNSLRGSKDYDTLFVDRESAQELMFSDTLLVVCDASNPGQFEMPELYEAAGRFIVIDHHIQPAEFKNEPIHRLIFSNVSSASELLSDMLECMEPQIDIPVAELNLLLAGIILDTRQFAKNICGGTCSAAQFLVDRGASATEALSLFKTSAAEHARISLFEKNIEMYRQCVAISVYDGKDAKGPDRVVAAKAANRLLGVEDVIASFVVFAIGDSAVISARSDILNVQYILELVGGGGHYDAAGATMEHTSLEEAVKQLKGAIDKGIEKKENKEA